MNNFVYHNPTKLVFGKGQIAQLAKLIPAGKKIMITCGGGSVRRNGIYDQVVKALEGRDWVEFWGTARSSCLPWAAGRSSTVRS